MLGKRNRQRQGESEREREKKEGRGEGREEHKSRNDISKIHIPPLSFTSSWLTIQPLFS